MADVQRILVTGATGKVGQAFIGRLLASAMTFRRVRRPGAVPQPRARAGPAPRGLTGSIDQRAAVDRAVDGVTHVLHLATSKETPETIMDVAIKGLFWLLEACRTSPAFRQFILIGGDAGMGHFFYPHPLPVTETQSTAPTRAAMRCPRCWRR